MTDRELDDILYAALVVLNTPEYLELPDEPFPTSPEFEAKMSRMLADPKGCAKKRARAARPLWRKVLASAAAVVLVLSVSLAGVMAVSPTARAWVEHVVVQWLEEYVGIRFHGEGGENGNPWRPIWLPGGFEQVDASDYNEYGRVVYKSSGGTEIYFEYKLVSEGNRFNVDTEHNEYKEIDLNGHPAYLFIKNEERHPNYLVWTDKEKIVAFRLMGDIDVETLIEMAKNISNKY